MIKNKKYNNNLTSFRFNQNATCFVISNNIGFKVYQCNGCIKKVSRCLNTKIKFIEMLYSCNIFAFTGMSNDQGISNDSDMILNSANKLTIWDDQKKESIGEIKFRDNIINTILCKDKIIVTTGLVVYIYSLDKFELIDRFETHVQINDFLISLSLDHKVLSYPGLTPGSIRIEFLDIKKFTFIIAHDSNISRICLNMDGKLVATCSEKGTLIRLWDTETGNKIKELRRGSEIVPIHCLAFSFDSTLLACTSNRGTIHIFNIKTDVNNYIKENSKSSFSFITLISSYFPTYFDSEWSFIQYRIPEGYSIISFHQTKSDILYAISEQGNFYQINLNLYNGSCKLTFFHEFEESADIF